MHIMPVICSTAHVCNGSHLCCDNMGCIGACTLFDATYLTCRLPRFSRLLPSTDVQRKHGSYTSARRTSFKSVSQSVSTNGQRTYATRSAMHTEVACDIPTSQGIALKQPPRTTSSPYSLGSRSCVAAASPAVELVRERIGASSSSAFHMPSSTTTSGTLNNGFSKRHAAPSSRGKRPSTHIGINISINADATYFNGDPAASGNTIMANGHDANQAQTHSSGVLTDVHNALSGSSDTLQHFSGPTNFSCSIYAAASPTLSTRSAADTVSGNSPIRCVRMSSRAYVRPYGGMRDVLDKELEVHLDDAD